MLLFITDTGSKTEKLNNDCSREGDMGCLCYSSLGSDTYHAMFYWSGFMCVMVMVVCCVCVSMRVCVCM